VSALWKYTQDPVNTNGSPYVAKETADKGYVRDNSDSSITYGDNITINPADKSRVIQRRENGTAEATNFDAGDLKIDKDLEVLGAKVFKESDDYESFIAAHENGIFFITEDDPVSSADGTAS